MSDKKEGAIYQCDARHWYIQSVGVGPGAWSLPFVGCPVCKLDAAQDKLRRIAELVPQVYSDAAPALLEIERLATGDER
jgi:hypothetical protein